MWRLLLVLLLCEKCCGTQIVLSGYMAPSVPREGGLLSANASQFESHPPFKLTIESDWYAIDYFVDDEMTPDDSGTWSKSSYRMHMTDVYGGTIGVEGPGQVEFRWTPRGTDDNGGGSWPDYVSDTIELKLMKLETNRVQAFSSFAIDRVYGFLSLWTHNVDTGNLMGHGLISSSMLWWPVGPYDWLSGASIRDLPTTKFDESFVMQEGNERRCPGYPDQPCVSVLRGYVVPVVERIEVIHDLLIPGDANGDGTFDQLDIVQVLDAGRYQNGNRVSWRQGDWNADGLFNQLDLVVAQQSSEYGTAYMAAMVPEPTSAGILMAMLLWMGLFSTQRMRCHR